MIDEKAFKSLRQTGEEEGFARWCIEMYESAKYTDQPGGMSVDIEAGARAIIASDSYFAIKLSYLKKIDKAVKYSIACAEAWGMKCK